MTRRAGNSVSLRRSSATGMCHGPSAWAARCPPLPVLQPHRPVAARPSVSRTDRCRALSQPATSHASGNRPFPMTAGEMAGLPTLRVSRRRWVRTFARCTNSSPHTAWRALPAFSRPPRIAAGSPAGSGGAWRTDTASPPVAKGCVNRAPAWSRPSRTRVGWRCIPSPSTAIPRAPRVIEDRMAVAPDVPGIGVLFDGRRPEPAHSAHESTAWVVTGIADAGPSR